MTKFIEIPANKKSLAMRKLIYGIGINDANYIVQPKINGKQLICPFYRSWHNMIKRCYDPKYHQARPTYIGCSVVEEWIFFSKFKKWMTHQDWHGKELDKDIKHIGNRLYGPDNCLFVSRAINLLLTASESIRGDFPIGVSFSKRNNKFIAYCNYNGKQIYLGYYTNPESAHAEYLKYKHMVILEAANEPENSYIQKYLVNHAKLLDI